MINKGLYYKQKKSKYLIEQDKMAHQLDVPLQIYNPKLRANLSSATRAHLMVVLLAFT